MGDNLSGEYRNESLRYAVGMKTNKLSISPFDIDRERKHDGSTCGEWFIVYHTWRQAELDWTVSAVRWWQWYFYISFINGHVRHACRYTTYTIRIRICVLCYLLHWWTDMCVYGAKFVHKTTDLRLIERLKKLRKKYLYKKSVNCHSILVEMCYNFYFFHVWFEH